MKNIKQRFMIDNTKMEQNYISVSNIWLMSLIWGLHQLSLVWESGLGSLPIMTVFTWQLLLWKIKMKDCYSLKFLRCFIFTTHCGTAHLATRTAILSHCTCNGDLRVRAPRVWNQLCLSGCLPHSSYSKILYYDSIGNGTEKKLSMWEGTVLNCSFFTDFQWNLHMWIDGMLYLDCTGT